MTREELEKEAEKYVKRVIDVNAFDWKIVREICLAYLAGAELREKRIAELEEERSDLDMIAKNYAIKNADLEKENAELKSDNDARKFAMAMSEKVEKQLGEENAGLNARLSAINLLTPELEKASKLRKQQLTKAKEIIKELVRVEYADFTNGDYSNELSKVLEKAEQFLNSEVEK